VRCPRCYSGTEVVKTVHYSDRIYRRRFCPFCGWRFSTDETVREEDENGEKAEENGEKKNNMAIYSHVLKKA